MKYIFLFGLTLLFMPVTVTGSNSVVVNNEIAGQPETGKSVSLYYFYFVPRCDECIILDKALDELIEENFSNEIKNGRLVFKRINLTEPDNNEQEIIRQLRVRRQLLLLVSEDETENLTRDAFRFVERDRERFNQSMLGSINGMLQ